MAQIRSHGDLWQWLEGRSEKWGIVIASRAAARAVPALSTSITMSKNIHDLGNALVLPTMRALFISTVAGSYASIEKNAVAKAAVAVGAAVGSAVTDEARRAAEAAAKAADAVAAAARRADATALARTSDAAAAAARAAATLARTIKADAPISAADAAAAAQASIWRAVNTDADNLESGADIEILPLWNNRMPDWAKDGWERLRITLLSDGDHWQVWTDWYDDLLAGQAHAASVGRPEIRERSLEIAAISDKNWLNGSMHVNRLIREINASYWSENVESDVDLPETPMQGHGVHFGLRDGLIHIVPSAHTDPDKTNIGRLKSLLPLLRDQAKQAHNAFSSNNQAFPQISDALQKYNETLSCNLDEMDFDVIAGWGLILGNAESAANRQIADRLAPEMEDNQKAVLKSVLDLHGPFILATDAGQSLLEDVERYNRNPDEERIFKLEAIEVAKAIDDQNLATTPTTPFLEATANAIAAGPQPVRAMVYGTNTFRNLSIGLVAGTLIGSFYAVPALVGASGWIAAVLVAEGVKRSDIGVNAANIIRDALNDRTQKTNLRKFAPFILQHEARFRTLAGNRREFQWLHDWIDWLKANLPKQEA